MKRVFLLVFVLMIMGMVSSEAQASIVSTTFGHKYYDSDSGYSYKTEAFEFSVANNTKITRITLDVANMKFKDTVGILCISTLKNGVLKAIWWRKFTLSARDKNGQLTPAVLKFYLSKLTLEEGDYWIKLKTGGKNTILWAVNAVGEKGLCFYNGNLVTGDQAAFEIRGVSAIATSTPIPGTFYLLLTGGGAVLGIMRLRAKG